MTNEQLKVRVTNLKNKAWDIYNNPNGSIFWGTPWRRYWVLIDYYQSQIRERYTKHYGKIQ
jgi:hypothetical protein